MNDCLQKVFFFLFFGLPFGIVFGQGVVKDTLGDPHYREDQFYAGITYNLITRVPNGVNLKGISGGVTFGYLRDMPINAERNFAVALGLGASFDQYGQTLFIGEDTQNATIFNVLDSNVDYTSNRFSTATIEIPFEIRWRTSTPKIYKFWRVYAGLKPGYTYWYKAQFKQPNNNVSQTDIPEFQKIRLGATLAVGYGSFNFYSYYSVLPFFKGATLEDSGESVSFCPLKIGVIFYIL